MRNHPIRIVIIGILILVMILGLNQISYASLAGSAQAESGGMPVPAPEGGRGDSGGGRADHGSSGGSTKVNKNKVVTEYYYESISGNVKEDLGETIVGTAGKDAQNSTIPIEGVLVELLNGGKVVATTRTSSDGSYKFSPSQDGTYSVRFIYGSLDGMNLNNMSDSNKKNIQKALRYNGHDYYAEKAPGGGAYPSTTTHTTIETEIIQSQQGCTQVILAIDCSVSMTNTEITVNGEKKSRLAVVLDSAKKMIDELINEGNNIYIGIVFFSGSGDKGYGRYRACGLTKDKELLNSALEWNNIFAGHWRTVNTNIVSAIDKSEESFINNKEFESNRIMVLLSDGVPTADGTTQTYSNESEAQTLNKLYNIIAPNTKNRVKQIKEGGIKLISLFTKSEDQEENDLVKEIFEEYSEKFIFIQDGTETEKIIQDDLKEFIIKNIEEKDYTEEVSVLGGCEDKERRKEVDENFNEKFYYGNTEMFKQIDNYDSKDKAQELSDLTYMIVTGGTGYEIKHKPAGLPSKEVYTHTSADGGTYTVTILRIIKSYENQDLVLAQRPAISLITTTTVTGLKVTLADSSILSVQNVKIGEELPLIQVMDDEISHGATIEVEYSIRVKNDSSIQCDYLELINYLPVDFLFYPDSQLITDTKKNKDYGWQGVNIEKLYNDKYVTKNAYETYKDKDVVKIVLDNDGKGEDGFYIAPGGEYILKIVVSRVISTLYDLNLESENKVEVLAYKDSQNRRMAYNQSFIATGKHKLLQLIGVFPGDLKDKDCADTTNKLFIIPPTGAKIEVKDYTRQAILVSTAILIALVAIKRIKQRKLK